MASECAPVALFAYRRPDHLAACLQSLAACPESQGTDLIVFCDGPKGSGDAADVAKVRELARMASGFSSVRVVERATNQGLAASVISGVGEVLAKRDRIIVVEDDLVVSPDFLRYLNEGLDLYADDTAVVSIHAYTYAVKEPLPQSFFLKGADCWGWATWRRGWAVFDADGGALLDRLRASGREREFDLDGAYPYSRMLAEQAAGTIDSWAVRWHASAFLADKLTLYPGESLVKNIGQDGSGTHSVASRSHAAAATLLPGALERVPIVESEQARTAIARTLSRSHGSIGARVRAILPRWPQR